MVERPRYKVIAEDLRSMIESGGLPGGEQLPTELELRDKYDASRNTVRDAVKLLVHQGLVEAFPGKGTFVKKISEPYVITITTDPDTGLGGGEGETYIQEIGRQGRRPRLSEPRVEIKAADQRIAVALDLALGAPVISRHQERFIDDVPWSLQTSYYSRELRDRGAHRLEDPEDVTEGTVRYLAESLGVVQVGYVDRLRVRLAEQGEEKFFRLWSGSQKSVIEHRRITYGEDAAPIRYTVTVYHPDYAEISIVEGVVPDRVNIGD